jgi:7-dehydrocholesterol reductase
MIVEYHDGSLYLFLQSLYANPSVELGLIITRWPLPNMVALNTILLFSFIQIIYQICLPGPIVYGPMTRRGNQPEYKLNGLYAHILTYIIILSIYIHNKEDIYLVFDNFGNILQTLSLLNFSICVFLYFKGIYYPSTSDSSSSGNVIMDFYWGTELYPTIFGFNLKQFVICRFGMMSWMSLMSIYIMKQYQLYGYVSNSMMVSFGLQAVYCFKFFLWEGGYIHSLNMIYDRFGYYIYWGVTCWIPGIYTLTGFYLVRHPVDWHPTIACLFFVIGCYFIYINWETDEQRRTFRENPESFRINGRKANYINVKYNVGIELRNGTIVSHEKDSVLLCDGWWGIARHFHYIPEIFATLFWCLPVGLENIFIPYFYFIYLTPLLIHRLFRDEERCRDKYDKYWDMYCQNVPYRMIPYVF